MAIAFVGDGGYNSVAASGGTASLALSFPAGIATGNLVLAPVCAQAPPGNVPMIATPTGWVLVGSVLSNPFGVGTNALYLFGAMYSGGLTGTFVGSGLGPDGMDGNIRGFSGTPPTIAAALGNFSSVAPNSVTTTDIPGPSGFSPGQWNFWCAVNYSNNAVTSTSPALSNVYYNAGVYESFEIGTTAPSSAPATETITWSTAGNFIGVGVTIISAVPAAITHLSTWWPSEQIRRLVKPLVWDLLIQRPFGTTVPQLPPSVIFWDGHPNEVQSGKQPPGFDPTWTRNYGVLVPTVKPSEPWFDPPKRWTAPPGFESVWIPKPFGTQVPSNPPLNQRWEAAPRGWQTPGFEPTWTRIFIPPTPTYNILLNDSWWSTRPIISQTPWDTNVQQPIITRVAIADAPVMPRRFIPGIVTGDSNDMISRLTRLLPKGWWNDGSFNAADASFITSIKGGLADGLAWIYSLLLYIKNQTRLTTSTDFFIDLSAFDFFGLRIKRKPGQSDQSLIATIKKEIFRERVTRHGIEQAVEDLTQTEVTIFEPKNPQDSGGWGVDFAFDAAGAWGADLPFTMFITAVEPVGAGIPDLAGFDSASGGWGGSMGTGAAFSSGFSSGFGPFGMSDVGEDGTGGAFALADPSLIQGIVTNQDIYNTIEATRAAGVTCWVNIGPPTVISGRIGIDFTIGVTPIADSSHTGI